MKRCKEHCGPVTDVKELYQILSKFSDRDTKKFPRQEIQFQKAMHSRDSQERPSLYKINNLSIDQLTENLSVLLSKDISDDSENVLFSSEDEIMDILLEKPAASDDSTCSCSLG